MLLRDATVREIVAGTGRKESASCRHVKAMLRQVGLTRQTGLVRLLSSLEAVQGRAPGNWSGPEHKRRVFRATQ